MTEDKYYREKEATDIPVVESQFQHFSKGNNTEVCISVPTAQRILLFAMLRQRQ